MARLDPTLVAHLEWLGFVRPTGLVVSASALARAGAILERSDLEGQRRLRAWSEQPLRDFRSFASSVLEWSFSPKGYAGTPESPIPAELEVPLPDYGETLRPDFAVREPDPQEGKPPWQLLVRVLAHERDFDAIMREHGHLEASAHGRMERLLRQTGVPAGMLFNGCALRLLSAPYGESSGWLDFRVPDMVQTAGRPISTALRLLLGQQRLLSLPRTQRLPALLESSRKYQNEVSERLAEQVLHALYEFLRGFQAAHDASKGELLREPLGESPDEVYRALLIVILRLVFLLYAEERDLLPQNETFLRYYSLAGLHDRLREDAALHPDTMDQRYGAWAQLLAFFRMIHDGATADALRLPKRQGVLFDPDRYPFLEGRRSGGARQVLERIEPPLVPDGTIYRALEKLLVLDGERISYRALDVEQIGSVYETMMGFSLKTATGRSVAVRAQKKQGAPSAIELDALLAEPAAKRDKWIVERADRKLTDRTRKAVKEAKSVEDLHAALLPVIDLAATPDLVPPGAMVLQPSAARRRSGSHYTPRVLTEPIVRTTLDPILKRLRGADGRPSRPEQILDLKVCDPAMGSGAFLVEACRQLGDALIEAWHAHDARPSIPPDEDEVVFARRLVAQRCLYGVDRNPVAVDLAKVSLWLVTLARDHALTFVDHALRHGDSLVGLSRKQIEAFHWDPLAQRLDSELSRRLREQVAKVSALRRRIREADDSISDRDLHDLWDEAQTELAEVRRCGDLVISAFFDGDSLKAREKRRSELVAAVVSGDTASYAGWLDERRREDPPLAPFHWEIELPEVYERENPGFDAIVGNPPFAGKNTTTAGNVSGYPEWLKELHEESHGNADLVAHFYRRAFHLLRTGSAFGLIATNTIGQGDTRSTGLRWICTHNGEIFAARRRVKWPGLAAVVVSVVHVSKGHLVYAPRLDDHPVEIITAFLFHRGGHDDPARLAANAGKSFVGSYVLGMGFTFDDTDTKGVATPIAEMHRLIEKDPRNAERIFPYIGGEEINSSPTHAHHRYVINFGEMTEQEARSWADLVNVVETKVRGTRGSHSTAPWWQFERSRAELYAAAHKLSRVLAICRHQPQWAVAFMSARSVFAESVIVVSCDTWSALCAIQSRPHEIWARFFGSSMKDDLRYTPSDCFETFPFPRDWTTHLALEAAGHAYYDFRAALMVRNNEGLTATSNRFHDPDERDPDILTLRELHAAMDRAVLDAYGWSDIPTDCKFQLDYEIDEDEWGSRKKPWRYRWPDPIRDEVLARLLELNAERAREETRAGTTASRPAPKPRAATKRAPKKGGGGSGHLL